MENYVCYKGYWIVILDDAKEYQVRFNNGITKIFKSLRSAKIWITKNCL